MITVMANGCFDLLHPGHVLHLKHAREMGDFLIVALTEDAHVNKGPGRPIYNWEQRAHLLRELRCVNSVVPSKSCTQSILRWRPDIFVKGCDYSMKTIGDGTYFACNLVGAKIRFTTTPKLSTTEAIRRAWTSMPSAA